MAVKETIIIRSDDYDGTESQDVKTRTFYGIDGTALEIDLSDANYDALVNAIAPFVAKAHEIETPASGNGNAKRARDGDAIRAWGRTQDAWKNHPAVNENAKGRIPKDLRSAYENAHNAVAVPSDENAADNAEPDVSANGAESTEETSAASVAKPRTRRPRGSRNDA